MFKAFCHIFMQSQRNEHKNQEKRYTYIYIPKYASRNVGTCKIISTCIQMFINIYTKSAAWSGCAYIET